MEFDVVDVDRSQLAYVRREIGWHILGRRLLGPLLRDLPLDRGRLWAIVPRERSVEAASDLEFDAIRSNQERDALGLETIRTLRPLLEEPPGNVLTIEHGDAVEDLHQATAHAFLVGDSEFDYVTAADPDELGVNLLTASLWFPTIGVIGAAPRGVELPGTRELTPAHVEEIIAGLRLLLIAAWDADGYVFWEPPAD